jgi:CheY-like chemotaxis protein
MDVRMPDVDGIAATAELVARDRTQAVIAAYESGS